MADYGSVDPDAGLAYFTPPVRYAVPTTLPAPHPGNALFRHYRPRLEGVNVYLMPGGVVTEQHPVADTEAVRVFHGGHLHRVDLTTAALLTNAGYTVTLLPDLPSPGYGTGRYGVGPYGG